MTYSTAAPQTEDESANSRPRRSLLGAAGATLMSAGALGLGFSVVTQHLGAAAACGGVVLTGAIAEMLRLQRSKESTPPVTEVTPFEENELSEDTGISPAVESSQLLGGQQPAVVNDLHNSPVASAAKTASVGPGLIVDDPSTGPLRGVDGQQHGTVPSIVGDEFDEDITGPGPAVAQQRLGTLVQPADYEITDRTPIVAAPYDFGDSEDTIGTPVVEPGSGSAVPQRHREPWERDRAGVDSGSEPDFLVQGPRTEHVVDAWRGSRQGPHTGSTPQTSPGDYYTPQTDMNIAAADQLLGSDVAAAERAAAARAEAGGLGPLPGLDRLKASSALGKPHDEAAAGGFTPSSAPATAEQLRAMPAPAPESGPITLPGNLSTPGSATPQRRAARGSSSSTPRRFLPGGLNELSVFERSTSTHDRIGEFTDAGQVPESEESPLVDMDEATPSENSPVGETLQVPSPTVAEPAHSDSVDFASPTSGTTQRETDAGWLAEPRDPEPLADRGTLPDVAPASSSTNDSYFDDSDSPTAAPAARQESLGLDAPVTTANVALGSSWQAMRQRIDEAGGELHHDEPADQSRVDYFGANGPDRGAEVEGHLEEPAAATPELQIDRDEPQPGEHHTVGSSHDVSRETPLPSPSTPLPSASSEPVVSSSAASPFAPTGDSMAPVGTSDAASLSKPAAVFDGSDSRSMAGGSLEAPNVTRTSPFTRVETTSEPANTPGGKSPFTGSLPVVPPRGEEAPQVSSRRPAHDPMLPPAAPSTGFDGLPGNDAGTKTTAAQPASAANPVEPPNSTSPHSSPEASRRRAEDVLPRPQAYKPADSQPLAGSMFRHAQISEDTELPTPGSESAGDSLTGGSPFTAGTSPFVDDRSPDQPRRQSPFSPATTAPEQHAAFDDGSDAVPSGSTSGPTIDLTELPVADLSSQPQELPTDYSALDVPADEGQAVAPVGEAGDFTDQDSMFMTGPQALASQRRAARRAKTRRSGRGRGDSVFATQDDSESSADLPSEQEQVATPMPPRGPAPRTDQVDESYSQMRRRIEALRDGATTLDDQ